MPILLAHNTLDEQMKKKYKCETCGWEYNSQKGFPVFGVKPGTPFEEVPDDFCCPVCSAPKKRFSPME